MCGIIAYSGHQAATPIILDGLRRLAYRGYDSAGIAFTQRGEIHVIKTPGKLEALVDKVAASDNPMLATCGMGHTRWATHGVPNQVNAHPHLSSGGEFALVHNGIIENYREIKAELTAKGYTFLSETDTEVLLDLIAEYRKSSPDTLTAFQRAVLRADGAYALVLTSRDEPEAVYATRKNAPLVAGVGVGENFVSSDITAFLSHTRKVIFLDEGDIIRITPDTYQVFRVEDLAPATKAVQHIEWDIQSARKGGYKHFMLKEIFEQPLVLRSALAGRIAPDWSGVLLPEMNEREILRRPGRVRIVACGTSYNAGLWASSLIETWGGVPCSVEIASEFRYRKPLLERDELVILISQSGETADTLAALKVARECDCSSLGLCNVVGSSLAREADTIIYTQAGPEISVASTKALCSQMALLTLLAMYWGERRGRFAAGELKTLLAEFAALPDYLEKQLPQMLEEAKGFAVRTASFHNVFFLGRGRNCALAMEGALKLKELSYIHAEAYAAGEMKHGPIALINPDFLTIALIPHDGHYAKAYSNIQEVAARSGPIMAITEKSDDPSVTLDWAEMYWHIPAANDPFTSFLLLPMLQLLSYEAATYLGKDVDQPRNLAKSVTVE
ncbi:MAG: glutamine--fructose-6-phosphate transaminase (isomerizing) [Deltaproteobacteria bacterium]|jgi:glucosamine--fructose-6-phosphate aminotransferase (isomerizing)|nr:glutamine--fructose-6-phosphate transaminase (isomerizing) [Deltaproteobacteria bacterium]